MYVKTSNPASQDADGNWLPQTVFWSFYSICREQTNGKGAVINSQDGKAITFSSVVHLPLKATRLQEGIDILICDVQSEYGPIRIQKQLLKYDRGQLHNRIWL